MSRSTCIPLYPATDRRQTGNNFVVDTNKKHVDGDKWIQLVSGNKCPGVNAALLYTYYVQLYVLPRLRTKVGERAFSHISVERTAWRHPCHVSDSVALEDSSKLIIHADYIGRRG